MQDAKHFLASKTLWVHVLTLVLAIAATCQGDEWVSDHPTWMQILVYLSAGLGLVLRFLTDKPLTVKTGGKPPLVLLVAAALALSASGSIAAEPHDALAEVNAVRRAHGLRPFLRDRGLTRGATDCVKFRADRLIEGHTSNDFAFVPASTMALIPRGPGGWLQCAGGCGASTCGWASCCTFERWSYAGAAWCSGRDGRRYFHLFVR